MKTLVMPMGRIKGKASAQDDGNGFRGFSDYACRNGTCVLARFDRFSMAAADDARCPVCGERAWPAADETPAN